MVKKAKTSKSHGRDHAHQEKSTEKAHVEQGKAKDQLEQGKGRTAGASGPSTKGILGGKIGGKALPSGCVLQMIPFVLLIGLLLIILL